MATLSSALNFAISGLSNAGGLSALASRNVSNAQNPDYGRRSAEIISMPGGGVSLSAINRSVDKRLLEKLLDSMSLGSGRAATLEGLTRLGELVGDPSSGSSVAALLSSMQTRLRDFEANPTSSLIGASVIQSAVTVADALNAADREVQTIRRDADQEIGASVARVNSLLDQFKIANDAIVRGSGTSSELADSLDERDRVLKLLSEELGIRTLTRPNNDIAIYTDGGVTLFETSARRVEFAPSGTFVAQTIGGSVTIDGVKIAAAGSTMPSTGGKLPALIDLRDRIAVQVQSQFDEIAKGLIGMFAESDQGEPPVLPDVAGLFADGTASDVPAAHLAAIGLAGRIKVNSQALQSSGGGSLLVRDGGFGGPSYVYNSAGSASFQERIGELQAGFDAVRPFIAAAGLESSASILTFSTSASGWIEQQRSAAHAGFELGQARVLRAENALQRKTGVNIDEEMASMLDLERSYQASSKIIAAVDAMLGSLLEVVR